MQEAKENWQRGKGGSWHLGGTNGLTLGRSVAVKTQVSDAYWDQTKSYLQTRDLLLDASRSRNKTLNFKETPNFTIPALSSYRLKFVSSAFSELL